MGFVDIEHGSRVALLQLDQLLQGRHIAVHAEDAFRHDEDAVKVCVMFLQQGFQLGIVLMPEAYALGSRETDAVNQAGVHQLVGKYQCMGIRYCRQDTGVHVITTAEHQCRLFPEAFCQQTFQPVVNGEVSGQQTGRGGGEEGVFS